MVGPVRASGTRASTRKTTSPVAPTRAAPPAALKKTRSAAVPKAKVSPSKAKVSPTKAKPASPVKKATLKKAKSAAAALVTTSPKKSPAKATSASQSKASSAQSSPRKRARADSDDEGATADATNLPKKVARPAKLLPDFPLKSRFTTVGQVFVVGNGDCGQLGLGEDVFDKERPGLLRYFDDKKIVHVRAGGLHSLALGADGKLYSWGCNDDMALGRPGLGNEPGQVVGLDDKIIVDMACGDSISVALTSLGEVYCWGTFRNSSGPFGFYGDIKLQPVPYLMKEVKNVLDIACGNNHVVCQQYGGKIYTWGDGDQGQLGHKIMPRQSKASCLVPRSVTFYPSALHVPGSKIRVSRHYERVYCGGYCTFLVHESQAVFTYGLNNHGQLGLGTDDTPIYEPRRVEGYDESSRLRAIAGGEHHTLLVDGSGSVYAFGRGEDGQLGLPDKKPRENALVQIPGLKDIVDVSANGSWSLAVADKSTEDGSNLYTWGYGDMNQLCNGGGDEDTPFNVQLKGRSVITAAAGGQHSVYLIAPKDQ
ncbi:Regulator of chromosome condensation [Thoreauomyces humboldtii]|nr:Regulator of chromosome condensation [Thoreauomyces humboldtii]